jgi:hypothetical protein
MDMEDRRQKDENTACSSASINQTTSDPTIIHQTSSEATIPIYVESQQINETDLNLSITAALGMIPFFLNTASMFICQTFFSYAEFRNNCNYDENSDYEDST